MTTRPADFFSRICFHAACTVVLLTAIAHTIAGLVDKPPQPVADALMTKYPAPVDRPLGDILAGFAHHYSLSLFFMSVFGWVILRWLRSDPSRYRALCGMFAFASLAFTINSFLHFFIIPNAFHVVATVFYIAAFALAPKSTAQESIR